MIYETRKLSNISLCKSYIKSLDNFKTREYEYRGSFNNLNDEVRYFKEIGDFISNFFISQNNELSSLTKKLKKKLIYRQKVEFPKIREEFVSLMSQKLWENDIKVESNYSPKHSEIIFTGGIFAANKNKQDFEETIESKLETFRFSSVQYRWYKYDSDPKTYYLSSLSDSDITNY